MWISRAIWPRVSRWSEAERTPPQRSPQEAANGLILCSRPVALDARPLNAYQQQLIDTILSLRSAGWSDRQIATHFNATGYLTPRGCTWLPQSLFSIRKKSQMRVERLGVHWSHLEHHPFKRNHLDG